MPAAVIRFRIPRPGKRNTAIAAPKGNPIRQAIATATKVTTRERAMIPINWASPMTIRRVASKKMFWLSTKIPQTMLSETAPPKLCQRRQTHETVSWAPLLAV